MFFCMFGKTVKSYMSVMVSILIFFNPLILVVWTISRKTSRLKNRHLYELLEHLPAQRREVFILTYIKGLTAKEVAEQTQMPQRTVESHLYLALRFLKGHMSRNDYYMLCAVFLSHGTYA